MSSRSPAGSTGPRHSSSTRSLDWRRPLARAAPPSRTASASTPTTMHMSATLNAGHAIGSRKSIDRARRARGRPGCRTRRPRSRPTGSHSHGRSARSAKKHEQARTSAMLTSTTSSVPPPPSAPNATPLLRTLFRSRPKKMLCARRGSTRATDHCLGRLVDQDDDRQRRSARGATAEPSLKVAARSRPHDDRRAMMRARSPRRSGSGRAHPARSAPSARTCGTCSGTGR